MKLAYGNMWSAWESVDLFLITTNNTISSKGRLIMGKGIAGEAARKFPDLPRNLANAIASGEYTANQMRYGLIVSKHWPKTKIGAFQTKYYWKFPSTLELIEFSTDKLLIWCSEHPQATVALNFPGIGAGALMHTDILPTISRLPDTVTIWRRSRQINP